MWWSHLSVLRLFLRSFWSKKAVCQLKKKSNQKQNKTPTYAKTQQWHVWSFKEIPGWNVKEIWAFLLVLGFIKSYFSKPWGLYSLILGASFLPALSMSAELCLSAWARASGKGWWGENSGCCAGISSGSGRGLWCLRHPLWPGSRAPGRGSWLLAAALTQQPGGVRKSGPNAASYSV